MQKTRKVYSCLKLDTDHLPANLSIMHTKERLLNYFQQILIVDDEENTRAGLSKLLAAEGFEVQSAGDGNEALSRLSTDSFNLVISDLNMPNLNGLDFLKVVQSEYPDLSVIILTATGGAGSYVQAMNMGAVEYLCKPLRLDSLKSVMHRLAHVDTWSPQSLGEEVPR